MGGGHGFYFPCKIQVDNKKNKKEIDYSNLSSTIRHVAHGFDVPVLMNLDFVEFHSDDRKWWIKEKKNCHSIFKQLATVIVSRWI